MEVLLSHYLLQLSESMGLLYRFRTMKSRGAAKFFLRGARRRLFIRRVLWYNILISRKVRKMAKEAKTNAMRFLEKEKVAYTAHEYPHEEGVAVDGVSPWPGAWARTRPASLRPW